MTRTTLLVLAGFISTALLMAGLIFDVGWLVAVSAGAIVGLLFLLLLVVHRYMVKNRAYTNRQVQDLKKQLGSVKDVVENQELKSSSLEPIEHLRTQKRQISLASASETARSAKSKQSGKTAKKKKETRAGGFSKELEGLADSINPIQYYALFFSTKIPELERFALRTQSRYIREVVAVMASGGSCDFEELRRVCELTVAGSTTQGARLRLMHKEPLLLLARTLGNQAFSEEDIRASAVLFDAVQMTHGIGAFGKKDPYFFAEVLQAMGKTRNALAVLEKFGVEKKDPVHYSLVEANGISLNEGLSGNWLRILNNMYSRGNLLELRFSSDYGTPSIDSLSSESTVMRSVEGPLVSVVIPTFEGAARLDTALRSLTNQTWKNIEIIVVDDGSSKENNRTLREVCSNYPDVTLLEQGENLGAYAARNAGARVATGEYITVHDDDDWSHPQKIEIQASYLQSHEHVAGTTTRHTRATEQLSFVRINSNPTFAQQNFSSLMIRRETLESTGYWDDPNRGADEEFKNRLENSGAVIALICPYPLSFTRTHAGSLTAGELNRGYQNPARLIYHSSYKRQHKLAQKCGDLSSRTIYHPPSMRKGMRNQPVGHFNVAFAGDYSEVTYVNSRIIDLGRKIKSKGGTVALLPLHSPFQNRSTWISGEFVDLANEGEFEFVSQTDSASIDRLIFIDPSVTVFLDNQLATVQVGKASILVDEEVSRELQFGGMGLEVAQSNVERCFSTSVNVFGAGEFLINQLQICHPKCHFSRQNSVYFRDLEPAESRKSVDRERRPRVGRHCSGIESNWPAQLSEVKKAYSTTSEAEVVIRGPLTGLGQNGREWIVEHADVLDPDSITAEAYLDLLDFWVYTDSFKDDAIGFPPGVLDAFARGCVVILPPRMERFFGHAALYATPNEVSEIVMRLWNGPSLFERQSQRSLDFVSKTGGIGELFQLLDLDSQEFRNNSSGSETNPDVCTSTILAEEK